MNVAPPLTTLSICSGGGGLDLGLHAALSRGVRLPGDLAGRDVSRIQPVAYVEREAYATACLLSRMEEHRLAAAPVWTDLLTFDGAPFRGLVDVVLGGTPCQDLSLAGKRAGLDGERSGLFWQFLDVADAVDAPCVLWENVGGARQSLPRVFSAFESRGYRGAAVALRAADVGATHERARVFLLAYRDRCGAHVADGDGGTERLESRRRNGQGGRVPPKPGDGSEAVAHAKSKRTDEGGLPVRASAQLAVASFGGGKLADAVGEQRCEVGAESVARREASTGRPSEWPPGPGDIGAWQAVVEQRPDLAPTQPSIRRVADGLAGGVESCWADRLRLLGNGVVPAQAAAAIEFLAAQLG